MYSYSELESSSLGERETDTVSKHFYFISLLYDKQHQGCSPPLWVQKLVYVSVGVYKLHLSI